MYKEDFLLNYLQILICHETKPNQTKPIKPAQIINVDIKQNKPNHSKIFYRNHDLSF